MSWHVHESKLDSSVNFTKTYPAGIAEARYVRRREDTVIVYLSSQLGCRQACKFCHLTATKQTSNEDIGRLEIAEQAQTVLSWARCREDTTAVWVHYNFMARGEPFASQIIIDSGYSVLHKLSDLSAKYSLMPKFKISTIFPKSLPDNFDIARTFSPFDPDIYYSIYSVKEEFRRKWMPNAMPVDRAIDILKRYQNHTHKIPRLHWALIKGENDSFEDIEGIVSAIGSLRVDYNLVRYNPPEKLGEESDNYDLVVKYLTKTGSTVKIVDRVGFDVSASCGMFVK